jgi:hypothetical protein
LIIAPGNTYRYQRISNKAVNEINENLNPYAIKTAINESGKNVYLE